VLSVTGSYKIKYHPMDDPSNPEKVHEIDFTPPFRRIPMMKGLEEALKIKMPDNTQLHTEETRVFFDNLCK